VPILPHNIAHLLHRLPTGLRHRAHGQLLRHRRGLPLAPHAHRHQLLHRQPGRGRHPGDRLLPARHPHVQPLRP
ncbi:hypothetical protein M0O54_20125, partial [Acinetobacter lactucae]